MDCEGFDEVVLDLVYDDGPPWPPQLDEARRHAEGCPRCSTALSTPVSYTHLDVYKRQAFHSLVAKLR